jgi:colicin import membrane protein
MQDRNLTRKSAIQFLRRQRSTNSNLLLTATSEAPAVGGNAHKATEELETLPPAQSVAPVVDAKAAKLQERQAAKEAKAQAKQVAAKAKQDAKAAKKAEREAAKAAAAANAPANTDDTRRARNTVFDAAKAVELYKAGTKVVDIAVALGYERGQGQNRTRAALKAAGVLVETVAAAPEAPAAA